MREICLGVEVLMQPKPNKNPGGDCFACALFATLRYLFPDNYPDFDTVWNFFMQKYYKSEEKGLSNTWPGMKKAIQTAKYEHEIPLEYEYHFVHNQYDGEMRSNTFYMSHNLPDLYYRALEGRLSAGWVILAEVSNKAEGPFTDGRFNDSDHFIVIDGIREEWEDVLKNGEKLGSSLNKQVHVVCSAKGSRWVRLYDLLYKYGAAGWWCIRKAQK